MTQRETKVRAWNENNKVMLYSKESLAEFFGDIESAEKMGMKIIKLEFTGLHDKNGKEIYENDVISAPENDGRIYKIKWNDGDFRWSAISGNGNERVFYDMKNGEIIGNIYENEKLLK